MTKWRPPDWEEITASLLRKAIKYDLTRGEVGEAFADALLEALRKSMPDNAHVEVERGFPTSGTWVFIPDDPAPESKPAGTRITRSEALRIAQGVMLRAEGERLEQVTKEAQGPAPEPHHGPCPYHGNYEVCPKGQCEKCKPPFLDEESN